MMAASNLVSCRVRPFSVTAIRCRPTFSSKVERFCDPLGLPLGLPETPLVNRVFSGGLPYPTLSATVHLQSTGQIVEGLAAGQMNRVVTGMFLPATNRDVDVKWIDLNAETDAADSFCGD